MPVQPTVDLLAAGGAALGRRAWGEAEDAYRLVLTNEESPEALEGLAVARWWQDDVGAAITARERAYALRRHRGEVVEAARVAGFLAWDYGAMRGAHAVANGWLQRARSLIADLPPAAEHAWLPLIEASFHIDTDAQAVLRLSREAGEEARERGGLDIEMTARTLEGLALVSLGQVEEGTRLLDEGLAAAFGGELYDPIAIGSCCCNMIIACERARDFDRAEQWCEQLAAFCERTGQRPLLALCRAHHGAVRMMRGEWERAEADLEWATATLSVVRPPLAEYACSRLAQLRRRQGRSDEARALLGDAGTHVLVALVDAELRLDAGDIAGAHASASRYLRGLGGGVPIESAAAFELLVEIRIRQRDLEAARRAHERLAAIAADVGSAPLHAAERLAAGRIALAERDAEGARAAFEDAIDGYERCVMPFEADLARAELARASEADPRQGELTRREAEVMGLVAQGLSNRQIAERLVVSEHTVHRHVANIFVRLGVSSRAAAVAVAGASGHLGEDGPIG